MRIEQEHRIRQSFEAEHAILFAFIRSKIRSVEESEDLLQDVYVQAMSSLNVLESIDNLAGWLFTVARNKIIDWYRKRRLPTVSLDAPAENGLRFQDVLAEQFPEDLDDDSRDFLVNAIWAAVDELPEKQRFVFIQQVVEGRTFRELAEQTGESVNTLLARKRYAVQFLQSKLIQIRKTMLET
ncbi:MAG: RNA polymerase sigma factor [Candidatus Zhuqueibacterota bacterium]